MIGAFFNAKKEGIIIAEFYVFETKYTLKAMLPSGQVVELTNLVTALEWSDQAEEISQRASITLANTKTEQGYLSDILKLCTPIYIFANGKEVFRGIIWEWAYKSALEKEIRITAYNQIIKSTKSKDNNYYTAGKSTQDIVTELCGKWGIALKYNYGNHTHPKLVLNNQAISEQLFKILDEAKTKLEKDYVMYMAEDVLNITEYGTNKEVFYFHAQNVISTSDKLSLDQLVTKVMIYGKEDKDGRIPLEHPEFGNTEYGTIQEIVSKSGNTSLADAQAEAKKIIKERGKPNETITISAPDVPQIRKGDKIKVAAGNLSGFFYVKGVSHSATERTMEMELKR